MNAEEFNVLHPVGTPVFAYPVCRPEDCPNDPRLVTRTRSKAERLGGHTDVVWVDGYSSCIAFTHIDVVSEDEWAAAKTAEAVRAEGALPMPVGPDLRSVVHAALSSVQGTTHHLGLVTLEVLTDRVTDALTRADVTPPSAPAAAVSVEETGNPNDHRRRIYIDGKGDGWIDLTVDPETGERDLTGITNAWKVASADEVRNDTGGLTEIGRCW